MMANAEKPAAGSTKFDPYHRWLGVSPKDQPPTYYRLLGIDPFEPDPEVIRDAAERQMAHVRRYQLGKYSELSQKILNELGTAKGCLLDPIDRARYDWQLKERLTKAERPPSVNRKTVSWKNPPILWVASAVGVTLLSALSLVIVASTSRRPDESDKITSAQPSQQHEEKQSIRTLALERALAAVELTSPAFGSGRHLEIVIDGRAVRHGREPFERGLFVVALVEGKVVLHQLYDCLGLAAAADQFAEAIKKLPAGAIVILVVGDDATQNFNQNAQQAILSIGGQIGLLGKPSRSTYYCIGQKGIGVGMATEAIGRHDLHYPATSRGRQKTVATTPVPTTEAKSERPTTGSGANTDPERATQRKTPHPKWQREYGGKPLSFWILQAKSNSTESRKAAATAFGNMGPPAIPALIELLKDKEHMVRWNAAQALVRGNMGPEAKTAIPILTKWLKDRDEDARRAAAWTLGNVGPEAKAAIPDLTGLLKDKEPNVRCEAAWALGRMGPEARTAIPALIELLKDKEPNVRCEAAWALGRMGPEARTAIPALIELLKDKEQIVRWHVAQALGSMGPEAKAAIPDLTGLLKDNNKCVRWSAAQALGNMGPEAKAAIPDLTGLLKDKEPNVRRFAAIALGRMGPEAKATIPDLTDLLKDKENFVRQVAAIVLGNMGPEARTAIPALIELLKDKENFVRQAAAEALKKIADEKKG